MGWLQKGRSLVPTKTPAFSFSTTPPAPEFSLDGVSTSGARSCHSLAPFRQFSHDLRLHRLWHAARWPRSPPFCIPQPQRNHAEIHQLRPVGDRTAYPGPSWKAWECGVGLRNSGSVSPGTSVLRVHRWTVCQPDRQGALFARWQGLRAGHQQWTEPLARRIGRIRQEALDGRPHPDHRGGGLHGPYLHEPRWRRRLPRSPDRHGDLHVDPR